MLNTSDSVAAVYDRRTKETALTERRYSPFRPC